jgi:fluoride ion exporter CrcB/FEX
MGIMFVLEVSQPNSFYTRPTAIYDFSTAFFSISFSLNFLLTLMIIVRLSWHSRNIRKVLGATTGASGTYKTIVTILVESFTLYAVNYALFIGLWIDDNAAAAIFQAILGEVQVRVGFAPS